MKKGVAIIVAVVVVVAVVATWRASTPSERTDAGSVVGIVALIRSSAPMDDIFNGHFCGGVLVEEDTVLTAAHCVSSAAPESIEAVVGADNLCHTEVIDGTRVGVSAVDIDRRYDPASGRFDLATLTLDVPVSSTWARAVAPPPVRQGIRVVALGWGSASVGGVPACRLQRVDLVTISRNECEEALASSPRALDPTSMLCARPDRAGGADSCTGDSGGPLLLDDGSRPALVVGIVSWGTGCRPGDAGVYARADTWREGAPGP